MRPRITLLLLFPALTALLFANTQPQSSTGLRVNGQRLNAHLAELSQFGKNPQGGVSRVAYSEADLQGRQYVVKLMQAAKLDVTIDAAGNIVGRRAGSDQGLQRFSIVWDLLMVGQVSNLPHTA